MTPQPLRRILAALAVALAAAASCPGCGKAQAPEAAAPPSATADAAAAPGADPARAPAAAATAVPAAAPVAADPEGKVVLWHAYRDAERAAIDQLVDHWNKNHPKLSVEALAVPIDAIIDKFQVAVPNGNGPDLIVFAHDKIGVWAKDGLIQPLGDFATPERLKRFLPQTVRPLVHDKAIYGLPLAFKSLVLFYNQKLVPTPPKTLGQLIEVAKGLTRPDAEAFGLAYEAANLYFHAPFLFGAGGTVFDDSGRVPAIDGTAARQAIETARDLYKVHKILPQGSISGFVLTAMFNDGKVPFVFQGPWFIGEIDKSVQWAVAPLPELAPGKPLKPFLGSEAVMLSKKATHVAAALRIVDYLTSDEAALVRVSVGRQMVANVKTYEMPKWADDPVVKVFRAQADMAVAMPAAAEMAAVWNPYNTALQKAIYGETPAAEALGEAARKIGEDIARMNK